MTTGQGDLAALQEKAQEDYLDYLRDAANDFEQAIAALKTPIADGQASFSENDDATLKKARNTAHKLKGNALMYGYGPLGEAAGHLEALLGISRSDDSEIGQIMALISIIDDITDICAAARKPEPDWLRKTPPETLSAYVRDAVSGADTVQSLVGVSSSPTPPAMALNRKSILLAYKDPWISGLLASLLEPSFEVHQCQTGLCAIKTINRVTPDLVVTEQTFDDTSGFIIAEQARGRAGNDALPVIMIMESDDQGDIAYALSQGITDYFETAHDVLPLTLRIRDLMTGPKSRILVVDDDSAVRDLLTRRFEAEGFVVDTVGDGVEALSYLTQHTPDLVILDRLMPRLEGTAVLYEIQSKINLKSIPVMILTAMTSRSEASEWFKRGAIDFIAKPFNPDEVIMRAKKYIDK